MADVIREERLPYGGRYRADDIRVHQQGAGLSRGLLFGLLGLLALGLFALFAYQCNHAARVREAERNLMQPVPATEPPKLEPAPAPAIVPPKLTEEESTKPESTTEPKTAMGEHETTVEKSPVLPEETVKKEETAKTEETPGMGKGEEKTAPSPMKAEEKPMKGEQEKQMTRGTAKAEQPAAPAPTTKAAPKTAAVPKRAQAQKTPGMSERAGATPAAGQRAERIDQPSPGGGKCTRLNIYFTADRAVFTERDLGMIDNLASCLRANPTAKVTLEGRTDGRETRSPYVPIDRQRADVLASELLTRGVAPNQMTLIEGPPQCFDDSPLCLQKNRSVSAITE
ncbi:MAG: hypothetical protein HOW73_05755 [Polyangiaceae bacterium]|nr:hypothetical protein [Polyangiaceae bacterium]